MLLGSDIGQKTTDVGNHGKAPCGQMLIIVDLVGPVLPQRPGLKRILNLWISPCCSLCLQVHCAGKFGL